MLPVGLASLVAHAVLVVVLMFGHLLVGRTPLQEPQTPAAVEIVLGEGGETDRDAGGTPAAPKLEGTDTPRPQPVSPPQPMPTPDRAAAPAPDELAPPPQNPAQPAEEAQAAAPPPSLVDGPTEAAPVAAPGAPATVNLGDGGGRPAADLLDPEHTRFRAATQDTGNRPPVYPIDAARRFEAGTVRLQLFIDPAGRVTNVVVSQSSGSPSLDRAARDQLRSWRFTPAQRDGRAVPDVVEIDIKFELM